MADMFDETREHVEADLADYETTREPAGYQSPLLARMDNVGKLSLDMLREHVPRFHDGEAAALVLANDGDSLSEKEHDALSLAVRAGEDSKELLMLAGLPLIKHLAKKELQRRQAWQSTATLEDLFQDGAAGFIQGLRAYKPGNARTSPTNYLGQWITTTMRRKVESIDNDFGVAFDNAELFRKIRAIRSRLRSELQREPTDEEVLVASTDPTYKGGQKLGRVDKKPPSKRSQMTQKNLDEERATRGRVGHASRFGTGSDSDEYDGVNPEAGHAIGAGSAHDDMTESVLEAGAQEGLARLLNDAFHLMGLPQAQREVIARRFGLPPHMVEQSARDISRDMNLHREKVGKIIDAFNEEMSRRGGAFHRACGQWDDDDLLDLGLGWTISLLGKWDPGTYGTAITVADILTVPLAQRDGTVPPPAQTDGVKGSEVAAQFVCDYHDWGYVAVYPDRAVVPRTRACPKCGRPGTVVRVMSAK